MAVTATTPAANTYAALNGNTAANGTWTIAGITGQRHLLGIAFHDLSAARAFTGWHHDPEVKAYFRGQR